MAEMASSLPKIYTPFLGSSVLLESGFSGQGYTSQHCTPTSCIWRGVSEQVFKWFVGWSG